MSVYTVSLRDTSSLGQVNVGDGTLLANLSVAAGRGPKGDGWTSVTYDENTGTFIFTSNDGLAYTSPDLRPEFVGDVPFGDNDKAIFGAGSDLQIYHQTTGTAGSYIAENGTGDLRISGNNLWLNDVSGDTYFRAVNGSYAKLYHAGAEKISTTATGIDVTGTVTADGLTVQGDISATNGDVSLDTLDLNAIAASKAVTAVDVFVYDTSKDSDGGAWRKRTQATSWYNETLNTATRGNRREFPSVAVIVAEASTVTIYDGDDPDLPMWMVFEKGGVYPSVYMLGRIAPDNTAVASLNGVLAVSIDADTHGEALSVINFVSDSAVMHSQTNSWVSGQDISRRNNSATVTIDSSVGNIVNRVANDVAMTVLPDAPIDPATGLQVPTIAVATRGGVSVITDSGAVYDITNASSSYTNVFHVDFDSLNNLWLNQGNTSLSYNSWVYVFAMPLSADTEITLNSQNATGANPIAMFQRNVANGASIPFNVQGGDALIAESSVATNGGLGILSVDYADSTKSMGAQITSTFNTGWQNGDIKGAWLSDTDDTDLVGGELVTNGTFDTDLTGWTSLVNATWVSGAVNCANGGFNQEGVFTGAKTVRISWDQTVNSGTRSRLRLRNAAGDASAGPFTYYLGTGPQSVEISTSDGLSLWFIVEAADDVTFDNISVVEVDADRSVNGNGLIVNGTITRTPVATGADLMAYSGFSASNYLEQPYNSDLDFGTGDFSVMGWVKSGSPSIQNIINIGGPTDLIWALYTHSNKLNMATGILTTSTDGSMSSSSIWQQVAAVRKDGVMYLYIDGTLNVSRADTQDLATTVEPLRVGINRVLSSPMQGELALWRISATAPSAEQIAKIYSDEKVLFQENAQATLYGTSDAVTALAHDDATDLLHVGTSAGRSVFQGLRRVSNTTTAVGTAISASNNLIVEE